MSVSISAPVNAPTEGRSARQHAMLHGPIVSTLLRLSWPNVLMMVAQSSTGLIETWFVARLGIDALAGMALVLPLLMLMQNMSQGAMGGGISSAIARALGAGKREQADRLVLHAVFLNAMLGIFFSVLVLSAGSVLYRLFGGSGASLRNALDYSNVLFSGITLMWVMNAFASAIRGTGNMLVPGAVICGGALLLIPLSPCLIFGWGPFPKLGVGGAAYALLAYYGAGALVLGWYCASGRNAARLVRGPLRWNFLRDILIVGGVATFNSLQVNAMIAMTTGLMGAYAGTAAVAGYGTGARLEYFIAPLAFGIGAPLVALVGMNMGAGQPARALRIALSGAALAFVMTEAIGVAAALWPYAWLRLFDNDPAMLSAGATYLRTVGPFYGFFGMGWTLYFACQGAGQLKWPLFAMFVRLVVSIGGGWLVLHFLGSLRGFFAMSALAMTLYGLIIVSTVASGVWFRKPRQG